MSPLHFNLCFLCENDKNIVHRFNNVGLCEFCVDVVFDSKTDNSVASLSILDQGMASSILLLEKEMQLTRNILNKTTNLDAVQSILNTQTKMIDDLPRDILGVKPELIKKYSNTICTYKTLISLFIT